MKKIKYIGINHYPIGLSENNNYKTIKNNSYEIVKEEKNKYVIIDENGVLASIDKNKFEKEDKNEL